MKGGVYRMLTFQRGEGDGQYHFLVTQVEHFQAVVTDSPFQDVSPVSGIAYLEGKIINERADAMKHVVEFFLTIPFHFREDAFQMRPQAQYVVRGLARDFSRVCDFVFPVHDMPFHLIVTVIPALDLIEIAVRVPFFQQGGRVRPFKAVKQILAHLFITLAQGEQ